MFMTVVRSIIEILFSIICNKRKFLLTRLLSNLLMNCWRNRNTSLCAVTNMIHAILLWTVKAHAGVPIYDIFFVHQTITMSIIMECVYYLDLFLFFMYIYVCLASQCAFSPKPVFKVCSAAFLQLNWVVNRAQQCMFCTVCKHCSLFSSCVLLHVA